ncbi:thioredoxin family protein [Peribacillus frigoritolerans]|uniref:thioredoxin family protein n=1 Tax=Peribacillus frigoritolerans TaxID=450367 RepID=UPI003800A4DE
MKKIIVPLIIVILAFTVGAILIKDKTHTETINNKPESSINMTGLQTKIINKENILVYFYSPECEHCKKTTPILKKVGATENIDLKMYNILNDEESWEKFKIQGTPTIIYYKNGKEEKRLIGERGEKEYTQWFKSLNIKD